jgi:hypothetical protein
MINYDTLTNYSQIVSKLSIFIFIIAANYVGDIFSCGVRNFMKEYMFFKHAVGLFIMLFFVGLIQENLSIKDRIFQSFVLYFWFIFINRAPTVITLITIVTLAIIYIVGLYINDLQTKPVGNIDENNKSIELYTKINTYLFVFCFIISILGTSIYIYILKRNLGKDFNAVMFLLGTRDQECFKKEVVKKFKDNPLFWDIQIARKGIKGSKII